MSILQISRIQMRRGHQEDLPPQLASGELGWSIDARRLFIGNGTTEEGAPELGNTEILTNFSDPLSLTGGYTFKGLAAGYEVSTGASFSSQVFRSMQDKFDDLANVRDFGAVGDGITDDTFAFNHALEQLYKDEWLTVDMTVPTDRHHVRIRRTLYVPAGTYLLSSDAIHLLPYVKLKGDGKNATVIIQTHATKPVIDAIDGTNIPTPGPGRFEVDGMTLIASANNDVMSFDSIKDGLFTRVRMQGELPTIPGTDLSSCVKIAGAGIGSTTMTSDLLFLDCDFNGRNYGIFCDKNLTRVNVIGGEFTDLYRGVSLGQQPPVTAPAESIASIKITHSFFDNIVREGIYSAISPNIFNIVSAFNTYKDVGNNPGTSVIYFGGDNCYSIGDMFDRPFDSVVPAINFNGKACFATMPNGRTMIGTQVNVGGKDSILLYGQTSPTYIGQIGLNDSPLIIEYTILRGAEQRIGTITVAPIGTTATFTDDYVETGDVGISLEPTLNTGVVELYYTSDYDFQNAVLTTATRSLTAFLQAPPVTLTVPGAPIIIGAV